MLHLWLCGFDDQKKCKGHASYPRISSNTPILPVYKYNFPLLNKHCWRYIRVKMDSFARSLILLGPGTSYFDYGFSDRLFTIAW